MIVLFIPLEFHTYVQFFLSYLPLLPPSSLFLGPINSSASQFQVLFCLIIIVMITAVVICPLSSITSDHILLVGSHIMRGATLSPKSYQPPIASQQTARPYSINAAILSDSVMGRHVANHSCHYWTSGHIYLFYVGIIVFRIQSWGRRCMYFLPQQPVKHYESYPARKTFTCQFDTNISVS